MRNKSGIYKIVAICASVIAALAMLVPTVTSAVGLSAANNSNHNAASAPRSATSTRSSSSSSGSSRSSSSSTASSGSNDSNDSGSGWNETQSRNIKCAFNSRYNTLYLRPINKNSTVYGTHLSGNGDDPKKISILKGFDDPRLINQIKTIVIEEDMTLSGAAQMFFGFENLKRIEGLEHIKFGTNLEDDSVQSMFSNCPNLEILEGIQNWDMSNVTNASFMFANDKKLKNIDLSGWQNVKIEDLWGMFDTCTSLQTAKMFSAKDGTLVNLYRVFNKAENLTDIQNLENWNTKNVTNMSVMFANTSSLANIGSLAKWNTEKVTDMSGMFYKTKNLKTIAGVENWDTRSVKDMYAMFYGSGVESLDLRRWKFSQSLVKDGNNSRSATAGMFQDSSLRDLTLFVDKAGRLNRNYSILPDGIWRKSKGKSAIKPGENIDFVPNNSGPDFYYLRRVRDYIKVKFASKPKNAKDANNTITCIADVLQGKSYTLGDEKFINCTHEYTPGKDLQLSGKSTYKDNKEKLALQAEDLGLTYTAKLIRESKNTTTIDALKNLLKEADNSRYKSIMTFDEIRKSLGIVDGDTVNWQQLLTPIFDEVSYVKEKQIFINGISVNVNNDVLNGRANPLGIQDEKIKDAIMHALFDITFTANVTHKPKPKPPVPTPPAPQPQPTPTPTPTPEPGPTPAPSPEPTPDDSDILPDITPKPDLNINSNNNFVHPFNKAPQSVKGDDVQNNKLQHSEINGRARLGVKEYVGSNSGTCKCVCPNLPKDAKSHKSNKSVRKSSNKAVPCKSGNNYSWLGIGGLIISWLIMLLIGFIVGYKMRKKRDDDQRDDNQSYANQSAIKDQSL